MSEFDDPILRDRLSRYAGAPPDSETAYLGVQQRVRHVKRRRVAIWSGAAAIVIGVGAANAMQGPDGAKVTVPPTASTPVANTVTTSTSTTSTSTTTTSTPATTTTAATTTAVRVHTAGPSGGHEPGDGAREPGLGRRGSGGIRGAADRVGHGVATEPRCPPPARSTTVHRQEGPSASS